jgi:HEAT repeat protein
MKYPALLGFVIVQTLCLQVVSGADETDSIQAWKTIDDSLNSGNSEQRQQALAALSTFGTRDDGAAQRAETALHDKDPVIRRSAAVALGALQAHSAIPALKQTLDDDTPEVSFAAAKVLMEMGDTSGRDILIAVLEGDRKDAPGIMTNAMREAKHDLHHPKQVFLIGSEDAIGAIFGPASMVVPAIQDTTDLKGKGAPGRAAAVAYLAKYPDPYAVQLLEWALNDENQFVRLEAAKALGERGSSGSVEKLALLLQDKHNIVRDMAATSMLRIMGRNGEPGKIAPGPVVQPGTQNKDYR